ncbi:hypothetical protein ACIBL3_14925 [Kribbella sp. NPDC050124]|uniref:beta family protein n=1 Tax=Kribbella sp. NPDC050124 TaxID=3364114 RepID=UPI0037B96B1C
MVPAGDFRTLVALRAKKGELAALDQLPRDRAVQPLLSLDHEPDSSVDNLLDRVEEAVRGVWELGRLVMLDATNMAAAPGWGTAAALERLADRLAAPFELYQPEIVPFVPVADSKASGELLTRISRLSERLGQGCALRIRAREASPEALALLIDRLTIHPSGLDLILDAGYVAGLDQRLVDAVLEAMVGAARHGRFRSITVLSGSVPKTLGLPHDWEQPRFEETLWQTVRAGGADRARFGDYGVVHPVWAPGVCRSKHISLKYTCSDHWLYLREKILEPDAENSRARTVRLVSTRLVESGSFSGPDYSWGDHELAEAAGGLGRGLGATSKPVAFATSHHLAYLGDFQAA